MIDSWNLEGFHSRGRVTFTWEGGVGERVQGKSKLVLCCMDDVTRVECAHQFGHLGGKVVSEMTVVDNTHNFFLLYKLRI